MNAVSPQGMHLCIMGKNHLNNNMNAVSSQGMHLCIMGKNHLNNNMNAVSSQGMHLCIMGKNHLNNNMNAVWSQGMHLCMMNSRYISFALTFIIIEKFRHMHESRSNMFRNHAHEYNELCTEVIFVHWSIDPGCVYCSPSPTPLLNYWVQGISKWNKTISYWHQWD